MEKSTFKKYDPAKAVQPKFDKLQKFNPVIELRHSDALKLLKQGVLVRPENREKVSQEMLQMQRDIIFAAWKMAIKRSQRFFGCRTCKTFVCTKWGKLFHI